MLGQITLISSILFSAIYPLAFLIDFRNPLGKQFHRFHIGLPTIISGVITVYFLFTLKMSIVSIVSFIWFMSLFITTLKTWNKDSLSSVLVLLPCFLGLLTYVSTFLLIGNPNAIMILSGILGSAIFAASLYTMNLGHWYLNVHGLSIHHLRNAVYVFWILVGIRLVWNMVYLTFGQVIFLGEPVDIFHFLQRMDGLILIIAIFFGTLFPAGCLYFVRETIRLKNTQSSTGILYVILCAIAIGELSYKYYLLKFGVPM